MVASRFLPQAGWLSRKRFPRPVALSLAVVIVLLVFCVSVANAQEEKVTRKKKLPKPEQITLVTGDGVTLMATYYPGPKGKETIPVILLHMYKRSRKDYNELAPFLQAEGHSVLVPDLRGHGDSTKRKGTNAPLNAAGLSRADFVRMVHLDMERLKSFLLEKNNAGDLNVEKLCVVGAEMGASVALNWTRLDWNRLPEGNKKQGQDVKAMVLISPEWSTPGLPLRTALTGRNLTVKIWDPQLKRAFKEPDEINFLLPVELDFRREVSALILVGRNKSKAVRDARRLYTMLKHYHPDPPEEEKDQKLDLFYGPLDTSLQGTRMLGVTGLNLEQDIALFIERRLVKRSFPWAERKNPYQ